MLSRAPWSARAGARIPLGHLVRAFAPRGPVIVGVDDTIERRWGPRISARRIYRDPVRSSHSHFAQDERPALDQPDAARPSSPGRTRVARSGQNVAQARRLLAIALVMEGQSRTDAETAAGMDRQSRRDWVHRFDVEGPDGLRDKPRSDRPARSSENQSQELDAIVEAGPALETDGVVRWRCADMQRVVADKHSVALCERPVGRSLFEIDRHTR